MHNELLYHVRLTLASAYAVLPNMMVTYTVAGETCLALPKLNLQFLDTTDYLLRNFNLFRLEATYEIREDIADVLGRMGCTRYCHTPHTARLRKFQRPSALPDRSYGKSLTDLHDRAVFLDSLNDLEAEL